MFSKLIAIKKNINTSATLHWLAQRLTAILLILLSCWLLAFLRLCINAPYQQTVSWLKSPLNTLGIELWLIVACYHAALGLQVVIEDYIANPPVQAMLIKTVNLAFLFLAVAGLFFIFRTF